MAPAAVSPSHCLKSKFTSLPRSAPRSSINTAVDIWFDWHPEPLLCSDHKPEWTTLTSSVLLILRLVPLKPWEFNNRKTGSCEMNQSISFHANFPAPCSLCPLWTDTWGAALSRAFAHGCLSLACFIVCHTSHLSCFGWNMRLSLSLFAWNMARSDWGLHVEAGCFHQTHTETFSSGQGFTIIWMFSGFPVSPEEILQHPVFFPQPLDSEPSTFWGDLSACVMRWNEKSEFFLDLKCYDMRLVLLYWLKWFSNCGMCENTWTRVSSGLSHISAEVVLSHIYSCTWAWGTSYTS